MVGLRCCAAKTTLFEDNAFVASKRGTDGSAAYAVLSALCHRGLLVHGLLPQLGVFHKPRFRSEPLVYDLMEAFRPAVGLMLAEFMVEADVSMKAWSKKVGTQLRERRVQHQAYTLKLMDAIEASANSLARAYEENSVQPFWVPELPL